MATEKKYAAAAGWAEPEMALKPSSKTGRRGAAAAEHGRAALERATGGRPPLDPNAERGQHARNRQVRLPANIDQQLRDLADSQHRTASAVMRDAMTDYLRAHATSIHPTADASAMWARTVEAAL